jgi:hypothetical protein
MQQYQIIIVMLVQPDEQSIFQSLGEFDIQEDITVVQ